MQIVSLFDYTGEALKPWAEAGFECFAYDIQHTGTHRDGISFLHADLHDSATVRTIVERHAGKVRLVSAFPVCTDLAASGACWWAGKREADPQFQERAARRAMQCSEMAEATGCNAWYVENPVGALSRLWRKPDHVFDPCEYGGYLSNPRDQTLGLEPSGSNSPTSPDPDGPPSATGDKGEASVTDVCGEGGLLGLRNGVRWRDGGRGVNAGAFCTSCATSAASNFNVSASCLTRSSFANVADLI